MTSSMLKSRAKGALIASLLLIAGSYAKAQSGNFSFPVYASGSSGTSIGTISGSYSTGQSEPCQKQGLTYTVTTYTFYAWSIPGNPIEGGGSLGEITASHFNSPGGPYCPGGWEPGIPQKMPFTNGVSQCGNSYWQGAYVEFYGSYADLVDPNPPC